MSGGSQASWPQGKRPPPSSGCNFVEISPGKHPKRRGGRTNLHEQPDRSPACPPGTGNRPQITGGVSARAAAALHSHPHFGRGRTRGGAAGLPTTHRPTEYDDIPNPAKEKLVALGVTLQLVNPFTKAQLAKIAERIFAARSSPSRQPDDVTQRRLRLEGHGAFQFVHARFATAHVGEAGGIGLIVGHQLDGGF